jgi:hypothetical protein
MPKCLEMTPLEKAVLKVLQDHAKGLVPEAGNYVSNQLMAKLTSAHPRHTQEAVSCLVTKHEESIGHSTSPRDPGNKLLEDQEEIDDEIARLNRRATAVFVRKAALMRISVKEAARRYIQGELWEKEEEGNGRNIR